MTKAISLVIEPIPLICVSVGAPELAFSIGLVVKPLTLILGIVRPLLLPIGALLAFLIHVARVEGVFGDFEVFYVGQLVLVDHLSQFQDLIS